MGEIDLLVEEVPATTIAASTWDPYTGKKLQTDARLAARTRLAQLGSPVHQWLSRIDALLGHRSSVYAVGDALTTADLRLLCELRAMCSGWYDGFPSDDPESFLAPYPHIRAHHALMLKHRQVAEWFTLEKNQDVMRSRFHAVTSKL